MAFFLFLRLVKGTFKGFAKQTLSVSVSIGYEDGRHFEEINNVQLQKMSVEEQAQLDIMEQHHVQLQHQQRQQEQQQQ